MLQRLSRQAAKTPLYSCTRRKMTVPKITPRNHKEMSLNHPSLFWSEMSSDVGIHWERRFTKALDDSRAPFFKWFTGGLINMCYNCVDVHVKNGLGLAPAIIFDSPLLGEQKTISYEQLLLQVKSCAQLLRSVGVEKGDRVIIYLPNSIEAVVSMLACARIGAVHCVVFGGFAAHELATRIRDSKPKIVIASSCGVEGYAKVVDYKKLLDEAIFIAEKDVGEKIIDKCLIYQAEPLQVELSSSRDVDIKKAMAELITKGVDLTNDVTFVESEHPLYILYTSGTTGSPKGVVRDTGGYAVALKYSMKYVFAATAGVFWAASDVGWVVGHSYCVYGPLLAGLTTVIYNGKPVGTPDHYQFWRAIEKHKVNTLFTAPTAIRAIKRVDDQGESTKNFDLSTLKNIFLAGERCDPDTVLWLSRMMPGKHIIDHWWQTESGWPICSPSVGLGIPGDNLGLKIGSSHRSVAGFDVRIMPSIGDDNNVGQDIKSVTAGEGNIVIKPPMPPGFMLGLWNADSRYIQSYFKTYPGYYDTGDAGYIDDDNYVFVMSRTDDVINVAGHRISTGGIEEVLSDHRDVCEAAVVGVKDKMKGQIPIAFVILNSHSTVSQEALEKQLVQEVRMRIGAFACLKTVLVVDRLPKTRSGKVLRSLIRAIANHDDYKIPSTIEDATVIPYIQSLIKKYESL